MFDIAQFELNDLAKMPVQLPNCEDMIVDGKPFIINFYGPGTAEAVKAKHKAENLNNNRLQSMLKGKTVKDTSELSESEVNDRLVALTHSFENFPLSPAETYSNPKLLYIKKQAIKFLDDEANFMNKST